MDGEYEYGQPIPDEYRERLYDWEGGGYSGCIYQMNQGIVDKEGHWQPLFSSGRDGIDQNDWYDRKIEALKSELGYDCTPAKTQSNTAKRNAAAKVFGENWWQKNIDVFSNPKVVAELAKDQARYDEFVKRRDEYRAELTHRLDLMFMQVVLGKDPRDGFREIGLVDEEHIKETCADFCREYSGNVGMMTNALDGMVELGLGPWCTCSDCGEQFQLDGTYEKFGHMIDSDTYHGDGGIGVIYTRVLCEDCRGTCSCPVCGEMGRPNVNCKEKAEEDWKMYDFFACLMHDWFEACWGCADGFDRDMLSYYDNSLRRWERKELGKKFDELQDALVREYGKDPDTEGHALYESAKATLSGRKAINEMRNLLDASARAQFGSYLSEEWFDDRLPTDLKGQQMLPGFETVKQEGEKE